MCIIFTQATLYALYNYKWWQTWKASHNIIFTISAKWIRLFKSLIFFSSSKLGISDCWVSQEFSFSFLKKLVIHTTSDIHKENEKFSHISRCLTIFNQIKFCFGFSFCQEDYILQLIKFILNPLWFNQWWNMSWEVIHVSFGFLKRNQNILYYMKTQIMISIQYFKCRETWNKTYFFQRHHQWREKKTDTPSSHSDKTEAWLSLSCNISTSC